MNIFCIVTTYKNRYNFLKKVINRLVAEKIYRILIIDNNASPDFKKKLKILKRKNPEIELLIFDNNQGTAKAISDGLEMAMNSKKVDYIWILDDDNLPSENSARFLIKKFTTLRGGRKKVLTPIRYKLKQYQEYLEGYYNFKFYENNFIKFNFINNLIRTFHKKKYFVKDVATIQMAPYGGLFFHKSLVKNVGLPNQKFHTYGDDYEYTLRMTKKRYQILLCKDYLIKDIDKTFGVSRYFEKDTDEKKMYLQIRNHTFLSRSFIKNLFFYKTNMYIFIIYMVLKNIFRVTDPIFFYKRVVLILEAIKHGDKKKLKQC